MKHYNMHTWEHRVHLYENKEKTDTTKGADMNVNA